MSSVTSGKGRSVIYQYRHRFNALPKHQAPIKRARLTSGLAIRSVPREEWNASAAGAVPSGLAVRCRIACGLQNIAETLAVSEPKHDYLFAMLEREEPLLRRRNFLSNAVALAAAVPAALDADEPQTASQEPATSAKAEGAKVELQTTERPGADFMIDTFKYLRFEYVCANPGSAFRGIQESVVNYGGNSQPEFLTCCHE
jgi:hypothetical protein